MDTATKVRRGLRHPGRAATYLMMSVQQAVGKRVNYGLRPFDREWDVLVVLDACRYDLFAEVAPDHPVSQHLSPLESVYSCATATPEWLQKSLEEASDEDAASTHLIAGNGHIDHIVDTDRFHAYDPVWKYESEQLLSVPPEIVTNAGIRAFRESDADRYILHYIQPHAPFLHCVGKYNGLAEENKSQVWNELRHGTVSHEEVWADYAENLRTVLDDVLTVIENASGTVAVTSDHGNGIGELGVYGHPLYALQPSLKHVPWTEAQGHEKETHTVREPEEIIDDLHETGVEEHLKHLGYTM